MYKFLKTVIAVCWLLIGSHEIMAQSFPNDSQQLDCCDCSLEGCTLIADSNPATFNTADAQYFILVDVDNGTVNGDDDDNLIDAYNTSAEFSNVPVGDYIMYYLSFDFTDIDVIHPLIQEGVDINNLINLGTQSGENTWYSSEPSFTLIATDVATSKNNCCDIEIQIWMELNNSNSFGFDEESLEGTTLYLYNEADSLVAEYVLNFDGIIFTDDLLYGSYYFVIDTTDISPELIETNIVLPGTQTNLIIFNEEGVSNVFDLPLIGQVFTSFSSNDVSLDFDDIQPGDVGPSNGGGASFCEDFNAIATAICSSDKSTYNILLSFIGGDAGDNGYNILSNNTGTSFDNVTGTTLNLGPFEAGTGFSYTVSVADHPECTIVLTTATVDCITTSIELQNFTGDVLKDGNELIWNVASENNTDFYTVEYSRNGIDFKEAGIVRGHGNSSISQQYIYLHEVQEDGEYYYRLQETDLDGRTNVVSGIISLRRMSNGLAITNVYPVPTSDWININFITETNSDFEIEIMDITGKVVQTETHTSVVGNNEVSLNASSLTAGTYFISISNGQETVVDKFVKN